ncbi:MAG: hypothetical protein KKG84_04850, partial [Candidatus Omnitrophica bacterium]|nr:hypothetical protein [Candidatus Omnitrophota bacterium]
MQGLRISHGDGWGFIHEDIIKEATEKNDKERVLDEYFDNAVSSADREFPEGVLIFKPGFEELLGKEENKQLAGILGKLYKEYAKGWRLDGKHEDLGPINGPFPITELIKANYIYTMAMIGRYAYGSRLEKNPESQDPGVSVRGSGFREIPGRKTEYNDRGQIARLTDDRGIVWEEYFYKEEGVFEAVDLYNPVTGKRIRCEPDKAPQKRPEYAKILIKIEEKNGQFRQVGDMNINADSKALFCVANIQLPETGEEKTRGKGIGKTVLRWIDMQAYRQSKPLEIEQAVNPVMAHIAGTLYEVSRLKITVGDKSYSDIHEEEELRNLLFERTYLLSLPGDFTYLTVGKGSDEVSIERVYNSRTGQLVKDNKLPPGYDYKIDKEKKRLIITDPKGNPARLEYFPGITFVGLPDVGKIVKTQEMENDQRVKGQGSGDRVKGPGFREIPGRKIEYNDRGQIARLTDDRGIVWEEYQYRDDGTIDYVSLHNPVTGRTIKCEYKGYPGGIPGNQKWVISREVEENGPVPIGKLIIQEGQDAATGQRYIRQSNLSIRDKDDRNKGISKTVKRWFALRAYRESKVLKFAAIWSPLSAKIDIGVCDISSLRISKEKSARSGGKLIVFSDGEDLKRQLLEQEFYFQGPTGLVRISVEPGTQEIVTTTNWPKEYTREIKDGELVVNDENGERISIRYEDSFYFEGLPDVKKIVGVQDVEESQGSSPSASLGTRESPAAAGSPLAEKSQSSGSNGPGKTEIERINIEELRELITGIHEYIIRLGSPYALESGLCLSTNVVLYRTIKNIRT